MKPVPCPQCGYPEPKHLFSSVRCPWDECENYDPEVTPDRNYAKVDEEGWVTVSDYLEELFDPLP